jgi:RND superfamily putative drug exporter
MTSLARWCHDRRWIVLAIWIVAVLVVGGISAAGGANYVNNLTMPGKGSQKAQDLLQKKFPAQSGDTDQIVIHAKHGTVTDAAVKASVVPMLQQVAKLPHVAGVVSPYGPQGQGQVSKDGTIAFAQVNYDKRSNDMPNKTGDTLVDTAKKAQSADVQIEAGGQVVEASEQQAPGATEGIGFVAAAIILFITFGSFVAMGLPLLTAIFGLAVGMSGVGILTNAVDTADFAPQLGAMIGLGVGVDYALFILTRYRDAYHENGADKREAVITAMDTAGRAVLFAGLTVVIALLGMLLLGVNFLYGVAIAASLVVGLVMLASLTLTPAFLGFWGNRIGNTKRDRRHAAKAEETGQARVSGWTRWSGFIQRRPWTIALVTTLALLALCLPVLGMRLGSSDAGNNPTSYTSRKAYDLLAQGFGKGFNGPLSVAAETGDKVALNKLKDAIAGTPGVAAATAPVLNPAGDTAVIRVYPTTSPQSAQTSDLINHLRDDVIPANASGNHVYVGGLTAAFMDLSDLFAAKLPLFIGVVVLLSALLLLIVFRSLVIPVQAAVMNLLSIGASLGVLVAVFQDGFASSLLGIEPGPIQSFLPVMLFAIVFGLSMDYEVFLVSRIREEWVRTKDASEAVTRGLAATGRVVTAAASIMILVFASFILGGQLVIMEFGLSLAVAVFIDAFFVRCLLLPAVLQLFGERTWHLPAWLDRILPHMSIEGESLRELEEAAAAPSAGGDIDPDAQPQPVGQA